jgi:hypothetical protein
MPKQLITVLMSLCLFCLSGCLLEDTRHTLYIQPDGSVTWRVIRDLVRSDHDGLGKRADEEADFLATVDGGEEGWSEMLQGWGAQEATVELLRVERPYTVVVRAHFARIEDMVAGMLAEIEEELVFDYQEQGSLRTLRIVLPPGEEQLSPEQPDPSRADDQDPDGSGDFRLVLTQGRFVRAVGFELSPDGVVAEPYEHEERPGEPGEFLLVWDLEA